MTGMSDSAAPKQSAGALEWILTTVLLAYTFMIHQGLGPAIMAADVAWYEPRSFLFKIDALNPLLETVGRAVIGFSVISVGLAIAIFVKGQSARPK